MHSLSSVSSLEQYVNLFSDALAGKVREQCSPLHDPATDQRHPRLNEMTTALFDKQGDVVSGCVKALDETGLAILGCAMGTGKTPQAIGICHCHADGKPYRALILCPPHLSKKWVREISEKFLKGKARATHIENWQQFINLQYEPEPDCPTFYIMAMTTAKLGAERRAAANEGRVFVKTAMGRQRTICLRCPKCSAPVMNKKGNLADREDIERSWLYCERNWCKACGKPVHQDNKECPTCEGPIRKCGEALWQMTSHKVDPAFYAKRRLQKPPYFDYLIRDESHQSKSATSIDGHALAVFAKCARHVIMATGTLLAGKSEDIRPMLFRMVPKTFLDLGFGWKDNIKFAERYGRIETIHRETDGVKRRTGKGSSKSTTQNVKPGIMPGLYSEIIANYTTFLSLPDLATTLPPYLEETISVPMDANMRVLYDMMKDECLATFRQLYHQNRRMAVRMLGPMLEALMTWPDIPYDRKPVGYRDDEDNYHIVHSPANLDRTTVYPKERKLLDIILEEKKQGRKCWVYPTRDDVAERLRNLMESHGLKVAHLKATVKAVNREEWIAKYGPGCDVGMSHPQLVETGIELFGPGYNFPTLIHY